MSAVAELFRTAQLKLVAMISNAFGVIRRAAPDGCRAAVEVRVEGYAGEGLKKTVVQIARDAEAVLLHGLGTGTRALARGLERRARQPDPSANDEHPDIHAGERRRDAN